MRQTAHPSGHHLPHRSTESCCCGLRRPRASCDVENTHRQRKSLCNPCKDTTDFVLNLYCNRWLHWPGTPTESCPLFEVIEGTLRFLCGSVCASLLDDRLVSASQLTDRKEIWLFVRWKKQQWSSLSVSGEVKGECLLLIIAFRLDRVLRSWEQGDTYTYTSKSL